MTETRPKLGVIIGQTRDSRLADKPARWLMRKLEDDGRFDAELVDLRDFDLPFFNEVSSNLYVPSQDPKAVAWQAKVAEFDAYVFLTAEYNHSISGALKNALDQAYTEWNHKPFAAVRLWRGRRCARDRAPEGNQGGAADGAGQVRRPHRWRGIHSDPAAIWRRIHGSDRGGAAAWLRKHGG